MAVQGAPNAYDPKPVQATGSATANALSSLDVNGFLKLMIAELQNQDPTNPLDNTQMLNQLSQLTSIESTTRLNETLDSVAQGQNLASASALIGRTIGGLDDNNKQVQGVVSKASLVDGKVKLKVGDSIVSLNNISDIAAPATSD